NAAMVLGLSTSVESLYWLWRELTLSSPVLNWTPSLVKTRISRINTDLNSEEESEGQTAGARVGQSGRQSGGQSAGRVAHLSDLHLVGERYGSRMEAGTEGPRGNRRLFRALRKLAAMHESNPLDHILVTGDITDAGTRAEWAEFLDLLRGYPQL